MELKEGIVVISGLKAAEAVQNNKWEFRWPDHRLHPTLLIRLGEEIVKEYIKTKKTDHIISNNPDLVQAIRLYACKYGVRENTQFLLAETDEVIDCSEDLDPVFESFCPSFDMLMELRSDLNEKGTYK